MTESAIYRLNEMAMGLDTGKRHLIMNAIDAIESLQAHLERRDHELEQANGELDAMTQAMIGWQVKYATLMDDFRKSLLGDPCDFCSHCHSGDDTRCVDSDCDCEVCTHTDCACHDCVDCDKWFWRGAMK